jgi:Ni/Co efflux regulator RcnB
MKLILCAMALAFAAPAAAQTAPAPVDHSKMDHSQNSQMDHSKHTPAQDQHKRRAKARSRPTARRWPAATMKRTIPPALRRIATMAATEA